MITEVLPSACAVLGAPGFEDTLGLAERAGPARRLLVLLVDGLGHHLLPRAAEASPLFADVVAGRAGDGLELACTLPSTTPTSLVSFGTGVTPGEHGILGFTVNVPGTDRVLTHVFWRDDPDPATWQPVPTVFERASRLPSAVVLPGVFRGSGLTVSAYRGARFVALGDGDDLAARMLSTLHDGARLVVGYTAAVDTAAHAHGIASPQWSAAAARTGVVIERLIAGLAADTALLVTADHGGLDVPASTRVDLDADPRLAAGLRVVAGEPRFRHLHTVAGAADDVHATWTALLGDRASVLTRADAASSGLFGRVTEAHAARLGDIVVICRDDTVVMASRHEPPEVARLIGFHGSTTPAETAIPLLCFPGGAR